MTLVQQAGTMSTVSGPAAFVTYRRLSDELHPAQADVHFFMYSSFGISAMVFNSSKDLLVIAKRDRGSMIIHRHEWTKRYHAP
jgi:hypothetical protein